MACSNTFVLYSAVLRHKSQYLYICIGEIVNSGNKLGLEVSFRNTVQQSWKRVKEEWGRSTRFFADGVKDFQQPHFPLCLEAEVFRPQVLTQAMGEAPNLNPAGLGIMR